MSINQFLNTFKVEKGAEWTHTSLKGGSYYIPSDNIDEFYINYTSAVTRRENLYLTERRRNICPITVDLDFRDEDASEIRHKYNTDQVQEIVYTLMRVIDEYISIPIETRIFVLTKPARLSKDTVKDGLHIIMPDIVTNSQFQKYLRHATYNTIGDILGPCNYKNPPAEIYDKTTFTNNWLMYGSKKPDEDNMWKVTHIFEYKDCTVLPLDIRFSDEYLVEKLSIRNKYDETPMKMELPDFEESVSITPSQQTRGTQIQNPQSDELIKKLVDMLSPGRANNYTEWIRVGWCLHNINRNYLPIWDQFSKQSSKYIPGECEKQWRIMRSTGLGIGSLHMWAKQDNPMAYQELYDKTLDNLIYKSRSGTNFDIAKVIYHMYKDIYACVRQVGSGKLLEYIFDNNRWVEEPGLLSLKNRISTEVADEYMRMADHYRRIAHRLEDSLSSNNEVNDKRKLANTFMEISKKLKLTSFKGQMIKECQDVFNRSEKSFYDMLDTNKNLIGFENGIYDLDECVFREGKPDDMVTMSTKYEFPFESNASIRRDINKFMESICSSPEMKEYLWNMLAYALHGDRKFHDCNLMFWSGTGANGKGVLKTLMMGVFGDYAYEPDPSILTTAKVDSSRACPELARLKNKRWCVTSEPEGDQKFQISAIKRMTGGDQIQARELYKGFIEFKMTSVIVVLMNNKPALSDYDGGIVRRMNVLEFIYKFVRGARVGSREKEIDTSLEDKFSSLPYKQEMMLMLLEVYRDRIKSLTQSFDKPPEVQAATISYLEDNNQIREFINNRLEITNNPMDILGSSELFESFKGMYPMVRKSAAWFKDQMGQHGLRIERCNYRGPHHGKSICTGLRWRALVDMRDDLDG
jgi:P4 family phage/plasmid primase-like protien